MIEVVSAELAKLVSVWSCWLEISQGAESWMLPASAPGELTKEDLQSISPSIW